MAQRWLILGAGGHASSVCDAISAGGDHVVGYLDDALPAGTLLSGTAVLGVLSLAWDLNRLFEASVEALPDQVVVAIGNPALRQTWQQLLEQVAVPSAL
jgi:Trk K+ transport system NAD-binding subunit